MFSRLEPWSRIGAPAFWTDRPSVNPPNGISEPALTDETPGMARSRASARS